MKNHQQPDENTQSNGLQKVPFAPPNWLKEKINKKCACGAVFKTWQSNRERCDKCIFKLRSIEEEKERAANEVIMQSIENKRIRSAQFPVIWDGVSFETSKKQINTRALKQAKEYAQSFHQDNSSSVIYYSTEYGCGKTHLAVCIGKYVLHNLRQKVLFKPARDLLMELKDSFNRRGYDVTPVSEKDIFENITYYNLIILDDVGRDTRSAWVENTYWSLFDKLMSHRIPVIITTNMLPIDGGIKPKNGYLANAIGQAAYSRLMGMAGNTFQEIDGVDLR